jgi:hypothetical protein
MIQRQALRNGTDNQLVRMTVGENVTLADAVVAIAVSEQSPDPDPTSAGALAIHFAPKSVG